MTYDTFVKDMIEHLAFLKEQCLGYMEENNSLPYIAVQFSSHGLRRASRHKMQSKCPSLAPSLRPLLKTASLTRA